MFARTTFVVLALIILYPLSAAAEQLYRDESGLYELRLDDEWAYRVPGPSDPPDLRRFVLSTERGMAHLTVEVMPGRSRDLQATAKSLDDDLLRDGEGLTLIESRATRLGGLPARTSTFVYRTKDGDAEHRRRLVHTALKGDRIVQLRLDFPTALWVLRRSSLDGAVAGLVLDGVPDSPERAPSTVVSVPPARPQVAPPPPTHVAVPVNPAIPIDGTSSSIPAVSPPAAPARFCPRCGRAFPEGARFCPYDGTARPDETDVTPETAAGPEATVLPEDPTVVAGPVPLTERDLLAWRSLLEFAVGTRLTRDQEAAVREAVKAAHGQGGALRDEIVEIGRLFDPSKLWQLDEAKAKDLAAKLRAEFERFVREHPRILAPVGEVVTAADTTLAAGKPPLTEQVVLAVAEFLDFHFERLGSSTRLGFVEGRALRRDVAAAYPSLSDEKKGKLVDAVFQWSDLRLSWDRLKPEDRRAYEKAFRSRLGSALSGTANLRTPLPSPESLKNSLLRDPDMIIRGERRGGSGHGRRGGRGAAAGHGSHGLALNGISPCGGVNAPASGRPAGCSSCPGPWRRRGPRPGRRPHRPAGAGDPA